MKKISTAILALALAAGTASAFPIAEKLDRGVVAVKTSTGNFISWRSLTSDDASMTFFNDTATTEIYTVASFAESQTLLATLLKNGDTVLYENDLPDTFK